MSRRGPRRLALAGGAVLGTLALTALAAPLLAPFDPSATTGEPLSAPSRTHPLGTNDVGQDVLSELLYGARASLAVGFVAALSATLLGLAVGLVAGLGGGWLDAVLMRGVDVVLALPFLALMVVLGAFFGGGATIQTAVIAGLLWTIPAREVRAQVLSLRERGPVRAATAMGAGPAHIVRWHLGPALAPMAGAQLVRAASIAILLEASLSFLGLGDASFKSWGTMLHFAQVQGAFLTDAWLWWVVPPGLAIVATVLSLGLVATALDGDLRPMRRRAA